jgi:DUF4097 and DUF4098 domain-containing protein YvlB
MRAKLLLGGALLLAASVGRADTPFRTVADDGWCQSGEGDPKRATHCEVREATWPAGDGVLAVDAAPNGAIEVASWDRRDVRVRAKVVVVADTEAEAGELAGRVRIETAPEIRADGPAAQRHSHWWVSFRVTVPRRSDLRLASVNGPLSVSEVEGRIDLTTTNGPLSVVRAAGSLKGRTTNGPVSVELDGASWRGDGLDLTTTNGPVTLEVPDGYNARLATGTVNGPIDLGFPITVQGSIKRQLEVTLGKGGPPVRVFTTNGPLTLRRP